MYAADAMATAMFLFAGSVLGAMLSWLFAKSLLTDLWMTLTLRAHKVRTLERRGDTGMTLFQGVLVDWGLYLPYILLLVLLLFVFGWVAPGVEAPQGVQVPPRGASLMWFWNHALLEELMFRFMMLGVFGVALSVKRRNELWKIVPGLLLIVLLCNLPETPHQGLLAIATLPLIALAVHELRVWDTSPLANAKRDIPLALAILAAGSSVYFGLAHLPTVTDIPFALNPSVLILVIPHTLGGFLLATLYLRLPGYALPTIACAIVHTLHNIAVSAI